MVSDNGLTFVASSENIKQLLEDTTITNYLLNRNVQWTFIPKRAPWFGGFYERLIGITKRALRKTLGQTLISLDELNTLVIEIEAAINDRPITYLTCEANEPIALTPSMLLYGRTITSLPHRYVNPDSLSDPDYGTTELQKRSKQLDILFEQCWARWRDEYLPSLREAHIAQAKRLGQLTNEVKVGDVVLVHNDITKRAQWPLAIVTKLNPGNDGLVRSVEIKTKTGVSNRPITKLYPLEVALMDNDNVAPAGNATCDTVSDINSRPVRQAAVRARTLLKKWTNELAK